MDLSKIFRFIQLTQKFRLVIRDVKVDGEERFENDSEHSYQLALFVWYLNSTYDLSYDTDKLIKYSLIHDLVEIYAGDTPGLTSPEDDLSSKDSREEMAFRQIVGAHSEFSELEPTWNEYREKQNKESQIVYLVDKVMPVLNEIQQDSGFYLRNEITLEKWKRWLQSKIDQVDFAELEDAGFFAALLKYLEDEQERLFSSSTSTKKNS